MSAFQKKILFNKYQKLLETFATDKDICVALNCGENQILKYSQLANYECFCRLLPNEDFDFRIILVEAEPDKGHWCSIARKNNNIYLYDPYGSSIDKELSFVDKAQRILLGEDKRLVEQLIKNCNCKVNIYENSSQFQSLKEGVSTCGRWNILFIEMVKMGYDLDEISKFVYTASENEGKPTDILVVNWVPIASDIKEYDKVV